MRCFQPNYSSKAIGKIFLALSVLFLSNFAYALTATYPDIQLQIPLQGGWVLITSLLIVISGIAGFLFKANDSL